MIAVSYGFRYRDENRARQVEASLLQASFAKAELQALKSQMHPHFLFNSLNAVSTLIAFCPGWATRWTENDGYNDVWWVEADIIEELRLKAVLRIRTWACLLC